MLLDAITGRTTSVLCGQKGKIYSLAFSPDKTLLASVSCDRTVKLWDIQTGGLAKTFDGGYPHEPPLSMSPDGTTIALPETMDGVVCLWNFRTGKSHSFESCNDQPVAISFSPVNSRRLLLVSRSGPIQMWDLDRRRTRAFPTFEAGEVQDLAYSPDGTRFVSCGDWAIVRNSKSGAVVAKLYAPNEARLTRCCFSPDGRLVACAGELTIYVWDITNSEAPLVGRLTGHSLPISFIAFSSFLVSAAQDGYVRFWQSSSFRADSLTASNVAVDHGNESIVSVDLFTRENTIVTSDWGGTVKTWDLTTGRCKKTFPIRNPESRKFHLAGDTPIIVRRDDDQYHIWDVGKGRLLRRVHSSFTGGVDDMKIAGDGSKIFAFYRSPIYTGWR